MGITVREAFKVYPFSRAKLLGGSGGLERIVESANIQEVPEVDKWLHGKEILFSAGFAFDGEEGCASLIERVNSVGAAAIALKPGTYLKKIPAQAIACADRLNIPLFELPDDLPYMDCIVPIFERINDSNISEFKRIELVHDQLINTMLNGDGLLGICRTLYQLTNCPIAIYSQFRGSILSSFSDSTDGLDILSICDDFENYTQKKEFYSLLHNQRNLISFNNHSTICIPIYVQDQCLSYLLLKYQDESLSEADLLALEHASSLIAVELLQERALNEADQNMQEKLLEDILMKRYEDTSLLRQRAQYVGINLDHPYCIFKIDPFEFESYIKNRFSNKGEKFIQNVKTHIQELIRFNIGAMNRPCLLLKHSVSVVGLISLRTNFELSKFISILDGTIDLINIEYPGLSFYSGISQIYNNIYAAEQAQEEATISLRYAELNSSKISSHVASYKELGALSFLGELLNSDNMKKYYDEHIGALVKFDETHNIDLIKTLSCYFSCGQNLKKTSDTMFMHKNSISYRLKKIEELLSISLTNPNDLFDLQLCLLISKII